MPETESGTKKKISKCGGKIGGWMRVLRDGMDVDANMGGWMVMMSMMMYCFCDPESAGKYWWM